MRLHIPTLSAAPLLSLLGTAVVRAQSVVGIDPTSGLGSGIAEVEPPIPCIDFSCRIFTVTTAHGFILNVVTVMVSFMGIFLFAAYVYAGIMWLTSIGDTKRIETAKKIMLEATIGVIVVLLSYFIVRSVTNLKS